MTTTDTPRSPESNLDINLNTEYIQTARKGGSHKGTTYHSLGENGLKLSVQPPTLLVLLLLFFVLNSCMPSTPAVNFFIGASYNRLQNWWDTWLFFGEISNIPIPGKTSPPPPCTMLARYKMTIVPEGVINIDSGGRDKLGKQHFFFLLWCEFHEEDSNILQTVSRVWQPIVGYLFATTRTVQGEGWGGFGPLSYCNWGNLV